jgi:hypothetical protein
MSVGLVIVFAAIFDQIRQGSFARPRAKSTGTRPQRFLGIPLGGGGKAGE